MKSSEQGTVRCGARLSAGDGLRANPHDPTRDRWWTSGELEGGRGGHRETRQTSTYLKRRMSNAQLLLILTRPIVTTFGRRRRLVDEIAQITLMHYQIELIAEACDTAANEHARFLANDVRLALAHALRAMGKMREAELIKPQ